MVTAYQDSSTKGRTNQSNQYNSTSPLKMQSTDLTDRSQLALGHQWHLCSVIHMSGHQESGPHSSVKTFYCAPDKVAGRWLRKNGVLWQSQRSQGELLSDWPAFVFSSKIFDSSHVGATTSCHKRLANNQTSLHLTRRCSNLNPLYVFYVHHKRDSRSLCSL